MIFRSFSSIREIAPLLAVLACGPAAFTGDLSGEWEVKGGFQTEMPAGMKKPAAPAAPAASVTAPARK